MKLVQIKIPVKDIEERIYERIIEHKIRFYDNPVALILGPNEYISLMELCRHRLGYYSLTDGNIYPDEFMGIPVRVMRGNGIDIEISPNQVFRFAKGLVSSSETLKE